MPHLIVVGSYAPLCPIVIDFLHQIKGGVGILRHITVRVGLGDQIAVAVVDINGAVAKRVDLLRDQIPTIILIQRDLMRVHAIEGIGIKAKEYKEPLFMILFDGAKCSSHASTIRVVVDT